MIFSPYNPSYMMKLLFTYHRPVLNIHVDLQKLITDLPFTLCIDFRIISGITPR
jgi:hypothetical protein